MCRLPRDFDIKFRLFKEKEEVYFLWFAGIHISIYVYHILDFNESTVNDFKVEMQAINLDAPKIGSDILMIRLVKSKITYTLHPTCDKVYFHTHRYLYRISVSIKNNCRMWPITPRNVL